METLKALFIDAMKAAVPSGCPSLELHRTIVRCYVIGWMNCLGADGLQTSLDLLEPELAPIFDADWIPDPSWCWWEFKPKSPILVPGKDF